jgi:hypothetical protein
MTMGITLSVGSGSFARAITAMTPPEVDGGLDLTGEQTMASVISKRVNQLMTLSSAVSNQKFQIHFSDWRDL